MAPKTQNTRNWTRTMTWSAHRQAMLKKLACLDHHLANLANIRETREGRITAHQLQAIERASGLIEQAMTALGCHSALDEIESDLANALAWIEENA